MSNSVPPLTTMLTSPPSASSVLALATTAHLAFAVFLAYRSGSAVFASRSSIVSLVCGALPWLLPSATGLVVGFGIQGVWFVVCERLRLVSAPSRQNFVDVRVLGTRDETADIKTIRLARPRAFEFESGQFVTVRVRVEGKDYARCYSICSAPGVRDYFEISVKRQGIVSNVLHATVRAGGWLAVRAPAGAFRYPSGNDRPILLVAGGIGITPLISMLRHAVDRDPKRPVTLIYSAHTEADFAFLQELDAIARRRPDVRVQLAASRGAVRPRVYPGRIDEDLLRAIGVELPRVTAFICGPTPMIESVAALLVRLGVPREHVHREIFQQAIAASGGLARRARSSAGGGPSNRMVCARSRRDVPFEAGQTLLEAAEAGGVAIDSLCRAGVCGTCRVQVSAGEVTCESTTLSDRERDAGFVLACVTTAAGDCTVDV